MVAQLMQFSVFRDNQDGDGFVKVDGSIPRDMTNRAGALNIRIPTEANTGALFTAYVRNMESIDDFICDALTVDIGIS